MFLPFRSIPTYITNRVCSHTVVVIDLSSTFRPTTYCSSAVQNMPTYMHALCVLGYAATYVNTFSRGCRGNFPSFSCRFDRFLRDHENRQEPIFPMVINLPSHLRFCSNSIDLSSAVQKHAYIHACSVSGMQPNMLANRVCNHTVGLSSRETPTPTPLRKRCPFARLAHTQPYSLTYIPMRS